MPREQHNIWLPSYAITVVVTNYNQGRAQMARITGPSGEAGFFHPDPEAFKRHIMATVANQVDEIFARLRKERR